jgi:hypothetical protein
MVSSIKDINKKLWYVEYVFYYVASLVEVFRIKTNNAYFSKEMCRKHTTDVYSTKNAKGYRPIIFLLKCK